MIDNNIEIEGARTLSEMLKNNTTLTELSLSGEYDEIQKRVRKSMKNE